MNFSLVRLWMTAVLGAALLGSELRCDAAVSAATTQETFTLRKARRETLRYLQTLPDGYSSNRSERWPLLLFLHGSGERGTNLNLVAVHGPPKQIQEGRSYPMIVISPQCPAGEIWDDETLIALLDRLQRKLRVDPRRVYVTGLSMGGYGTWGLVTRYPERFAAVAPICGGGERLRLIILSPEKKKALETVGIWAFHGGKDSVVPLEESERMIRAVKAAGNRDSKLTIYPDADHNSWTQAYNEPDLIPWLLRHSR